MLNYILRSAAVLLVAAALFPRGGAHHPRLLVIAFEAAFGAASAGTGLPLDWGPTTRWLFSEGLQVDLQGWRSATSEGFWRSIFEGREVFTYEADPSASAGGTGLWRTSSLAGLRSVAVGVPGVAAESSATLTVVGMPSAEHFIGGNYGTLLDEARIASGSVLWPYPDALERIGAAVRSLERREWSAWIPVSVGDAFGTFKVFRTSRSRYFLSPVYKVGKAEDGGTAPNDALFYGTPFFTVSGEAPGFLYDLTVETSQRLYALASRLAREKWDVMFYFDPVPGLVARGERGYRHSPEFDDATDTQIRWNEEAVARAHRAFDARVGALIEAAGPDACVAVIVDLEVAEAPAEAEGVAGSGTAPLAQMALHCGRSLRGHARADATDVAPTLAFLLGIDSPARATGAVIAGVHLPGRPSAVAVAGTSAAGRDQDAVELTARAILNVVGESVDALVAAESADHE